MFFANGSKNKTWSEEKNKNPSRSFIYAFKKSVTTWPVQKNKNLFYCCVCGNIFKIVRAKKMQEFDFT
jgi:hypothetical protein